MIAEIGTNVSFTESRRYNATAPAFQTTSKHQARTLSLDVQSELQQKSSSHLNRSRVQRDNGRPRTRGNVAELSDNHIFKLHSPLSKAPLFAHQGVKREQLPDINDEPMREEINSSRLCSHGDPRNATVHTLRFLWLA